MYMSVGDRRTPEQYSRPPRPLQALTDPRGGAAKCRSACSPGSTLPMGAPRGPCRPVIWKDAPPLSHAAMCVAEGPPPRASAVARPRRAWDHIRLQPGYVRLQPGIHTLQPGIRTVAGRRLGVLRDARDADAGGSGEPREEGAAVGRLAEYFRRDPRRFGRAQRERLGGQQPGLGFGAALRAVARAEARDLTRDAAGASARHGLGCRLERLGFGCESWTV